MPGLLPLPQSPWAARLWYVGFTLRHRSETINNLVTELPEARHSDLTTLSRTGGISISFLQKEQTHAQPPQSRKHTQRQSPQSSVSALQAVPLPSVCPQDAGITNELGFASDFVRKRRGAARAAGGAAQRCSHRCGCLQPHQDSGMPAPDATFPEAISGRGLGSPLRAHT